LNKILKQKHYIPSNIRKKILTEQNFCEECGSNIELEIHHIPPLWTGLKTRTLKILCKNCHSKRQRTDQIFRQQIQRFLKNEGEDVCLFKFGFIPLCKGD